MRPLPTDLEILNAIYDRHYDAFASFTKGESDRSAKIYVPVDLDGIADDLGVDVGYSSSFGYWEACRRPLGGRIEGAQVGARSVG